MKKITKNQIEELAKKALAKGNPYEKRATKFYKDMVPQYIFLDKVMNQAEIDECYLETARKDIRNGYEERSVGYYDKWYRVNHADGGRAYDLGVMLAANTAGCKEGTIFIECMI